MSSSKNHRTATKVYYLSSHQPKNIEVVIVQSPWYDDQFGIYLKIFNIFLDEDGLKLMDVLKWWRTDEKPSEKMLLQAQKCAKDLSVSQTFSGEKL